MPVRRSIPIRPSEYDGCHTIVRQSSRTLQKQRQKSSFFGRKQHFSQKPYIMKIRTGELPRTKG
jgi:hypothetical protein